MIRDSPQITANTKNTQSQFEENGAGNPRSDFPDVRRIVFGSPSPTSNGKRYYEDSSDNQLGNNLRLRFNVYDQAKHKPEDNSESCDDK